MTGAGSGGGVGQMVAEWWKWNSIPHRQLPDWLSSRSLVPHYSPPVVDVSRKGGPCIACSTYPGRPTAATWLSHMQSKNVQGKFLNKTMANRRRKLECAYSMWRRAGSSTSLRSHCLWAYQMQYWHSCSLWCQNSLWRFRCRNTEWLHIFLEWPTQCCPSHSWRWICSFDCTFAEHPRIPHCNWWATHDVAAPTC